MQTEKLTSLGLLAAGVAHEVNTPLAVISNYSQMLAKQFPSDDPRHNLIDKIIRQTFRASEIVNNLLNFSRTGAAEIREVDLNEVISETLSLVVASLPYRACAGGAELCRRSLPPVLGSPNRLQQVFLNLFMNARDAMPSGRHAGSSQRGEQRPRGDRSRRYRAGNRHAIISAPYLRSFLHHQGHRPWHRAGPLRQLWNHQRTCRQRSRFDPLPAREPPSAWSSPPREKRFMPKGSILVVDDEDEIRAGPGIAARIGRVFCCHGRQRRGRTSPPGRESFRPAAARRQLAGPQRHRPAAGNPPPRSRASRRADHRVRFDRHGAHAHSKAARRITSPSRGPTTNCWRRWLLAVEGRRLREENMQLKRALKQRYAFPNIIGKSDRMLSVLDLVTQVAASRSTVLITGESGTGKELIAKAIHSASPRADKPFVPVNSGSIPVDLLESQLFGHVKGAFTSAIASKKGLFEVADQGTIFFDEISTISPETQAKLLRVIQEREFMRLGGTETIKVDVRILAAANVDLLSLVREGPLPRGSVSSAERDRSASAAAAGATRGYSAAARIFPATLLRRECAAAAPFLPGRAEDARGLLLARKYSGTGKRRRARGGAFDAAS